MAEEKTPVFDWETGDFAKDPQGNVVTAVGGAAIKQVAIKALATERGIFPIYSTPDNPAVHHKYGNDAFDVIRADLSDEARTEELKRATREALLYLDGITGVSEIKVEKTGDEVEVDLEIDTVYDKIRLQVVNLNNGT